MIFQLARWIGLTLLAITLMVLGGWSALAIWFRFDATEPVRDLLAGIVVLLTVVAALCLATSRRWIALAAYAAFFVAMLVWWSTVTPSNDRDWQPDVARSVTATIDDDRLVVSNVRNFNWRSDTDFDQRWEERTYSLSHVSNVDLILSYWAGEAIAHLIVSVGFDDGSRLAFSVETRKSRGEEYSTIAGFFGRTSSRSSRPTNAMWCGCAATCEARTCGSIASECRPCMLRRFCANTWRRPMTWRTTALVQHADGELHDTGVRHDPADRPGLHLDYRILLSGYCPTTPTTWAPPTRAYPLKDFGTLPGSTTRRHRPMPTRTFLRKFEGLPIPH